MALLPSNKFFGILLFLLLLLLIYDYGQKAFSPWLFPTKNVLTNNSLNILMPFVVLYVLAYSMLLMWIPFSGL